MLVHKHYYFVHNFNFDLPFALGDDAQALRVENKLQPVLNLDQTEFSYTDTKGQVYSVKTSGEGIINQIWITQLSNLTFKGHTIEPYWQGNTLVEFLKKHHQGSFFEVKEEYYQNATEDFLMIVFMDGNFRMMGLIRKSL